MIRKINIIFLLALSVLLISSCRFESEMALHEDSDGDNIPDDTDNCINVFNPTQYDRDMDRKGYACDRNIFLRAGIFDPLTEEEKYVPNITVSKETDYFFVQLKEDFDYSKLDSFFSSIKATNLDMFEGNVYIIKSNLTNEQIKSSPGVRASGIYQPANRIDPELFLGRFLYENGSVIEKDKELKLEIYIYENKKGVKKTIEELGGKITKDVDDVLVVKINQLKLIDVVLIPDINLVNPSPVITYSNEYATKITSANVVHEKLGLKGEGEIITIADSGLDTGSLATLHPDLKGNVITIYDMGTGTKKDLLGHGTHVAATAVGTGLASKGRQQGSAPEARIIFQAVGNEFPDTLSSEDPLMREKGGTRPSPLYCFGKAEADANEKKLIKRPYNAMGFGGIPLNYVPLFKDSVIHTNSWGSCQGEYTPRVGKIDEHLWNNKNKVILFASGNDAGFTFVENGQIMQRGGDSLKNTARAKNAITVGATETSRKTAPNKNSQWRVASFSSKGDEISGRVKPDIVAPGTWILSARSSICIDSKKTREIKENEVIEFKVNFTHEMCIGKGLPSSQKVKEDDKLYMFNSGTSMATPYVAGLTAVIREYYKKIKNHQTPSASLVKATLINGAQDLPDQDTGLNYTLHKKVSCKGYPNMCEGWGLVNISASLFPGGNEKNNWFADVGKELIKKTGDARFFSIQFIKNSPIKITLAWTDPPPDALQNDLDLKVISPSGKVYLGNTFTKDGKKSQQNPLVKDPRLNNNVVEKVIIHEAEEGYYNISVIARKLKVADGQPFAVVASEVNFK